jgi:hypothetical protein
VQQKKYPRRDSNTQPSASEADTRMAQSQSTLGTWGKQMKAAVLSVVLFYFPRYAACCSLLHRAALWGHYYRPPELRRESGEAPEGSHPRTA